MVLFTITAADDTQEDKTAEERHTKGLEPGSDTMLEILEDCIVFLE